MKPQDLKTLLTGNSYPGRGILLGLNGQGDQGVIAYFIMGRSENSRNRVFVEKDGGIITQAFDPAKLQDPSLIIYAPVRVQSSEKMVVTNGDQTDTVVEYLNAGKTFEDALRTRTFEPDAPNFTPRISGLMERKEEKLSYKLSILKAGNGDSACAQRFFYEYPAPKAGVGHLIHTYLQDGDPIPSYEGEPTPVKLEGDIDALTQNLWAWLNEDNKVSLFVRFIHLQTGECQTRIVNKHK